MKRSILPILIIGLFLFQSFVVKAQPKKPQDDGLIQFTGLVFFSADSLLPLSYTVITIPDAPGERLEIIPYFTLVAKKRRKTSV